MAEPLYPGWADKVLDALLDYRHHTLKAIKRVTALKGRQVHRALRYLREQGIAVIERDGDYWLSEDSWQQLWYTAKRARDMVSRCGTTLGVLQKQDRHLDQRYLAPWRRRFRFFEDEFADLLPQIHSEVLKRANGEA
jgi:hypothetical protein